MSNKSSQKILVLYASWKGSSGEVSKRIADLLRQHQYSADCMDIQSNTDPLIYDAMIIGGGIRGGCFHPKLIRFIRRYEKKLSQIPVAYFVVCLTMHENTKENRCLASKFIQTLKQKAPLIDPISVGLFGGMINVRNFSIIMRWLIRFMNLPQGDFRDWNSIEQWAVQTGSLIQASMKRNRR